MSEVFLIGRRVKLPNGHEYPAQPFIAFESEVAADGAIKMIEAVSGERAMKVRAALYRHGETQDG